MIEKEEKTIFVDVREPEEFARGHVDGAVNVPSESLMNGCPEIRHVAKDTPLVVYCRSGSRSHIAIGILRDLGYLNLTNGINKEMVAIKYGK